MVGLEYHISYHLAIYIHGFVHSSGVGNWGEVCSPVDDALCIFCDAVGAWSGRAVGWRCTLLLKMHRTVGNGFCWVRSGSFKP